MMQSCAPVCAVRASSAAAHGHEHHHKSDLEVVRENRSSLNDIPIPEGSWQEHYNKMNSKWNMMLAAGVICFAGSVYAVCTFFCFCHVSDFTKNFIYIYNF